MGKEEVINFTIFGIACSFVATQKRGHFRLMVPFTGSTCHIVRNVIKKDSRTVIQNDKLEIVVSFENLVISSTNGFCIWKNYLVKYNFNPTIQLSLLVPNLNVGN